MVVHMFAAILTCNTVGLHPLGFFVTQSQFRNYTRDRIHWHSPSNIELRDQNDFLVAYICRGFYSGICVTTNIFENLL